MRNYKWATHIAALSILANLLACVPWVQKDYYSQVMPACDYKPKNEWTLIFGDYDLRPECREALLKVLPFNSTWKDAAPAFKESVLSAFHALLITPLAFPQTNTLFGRSRVSPGGTYKAGMIPNDHWDLFSEWKSPNQAVFNYVLNKVDVVEYGPPDSHSDAFAAAYSTSNTPQSVGLRSVIFYDGFDSLDASYRHVNLRYLRASTLLHEARHGAGNFHVPCDPPYADGVPECDAEMTGPHGLEYTYFYFVLQGAIQQANQTGKLPMTQREVALLGLMLCSAASQQFVPVPKEVKDIYSESICSAWMNYRWLMEAENQPALPPDGSPFSAVARPKESLWQPPPLQREEPPADDPGTP